MPSWLTWRRASITVMLGVVTGALVFAAPTIGRSAGKLADLNPVWVAVAVALEMRSLGAYTRLQRRLLHAGGAKVSITRMFGLTLASNSLNVTLPGGTLIADGYSVRRFRERGATVTAALFAVMASSALSLATFVVLSVMSGLGNTDELTLVAVAVGVVSIAALTWFGRRRPDLVRVAIARLVRVAARLSRRDADELHARLREMRDEMRSVSMRRRDWLLASVAAMSNWVCDCAALYACCRAAGVHVGIGLTLTAYVLGVGASSISILPGGLGAADAAMIVCLRHGAVTAESATAGVLLYRFVSLGLVVATGWLVWLALSISDRRRARRMEQSESADAPTDDDDPAHVDDAVADAKTDDPGWTDGAYAPTPVVNDSQPAPIR